MTASATHGAIDAVWRIESARLIAGLARVVRDVGLAEELAHDALVAALEQWPSSGVPENPGAWLLTIARRRAIDHVRRDVRLERARERLGRVAEAERDLAGPDIDAAIDDGVGDDLLRLLFTACHPVLSTEARVALTLRLLGGLTTEEIARAFLVSEPTVAQRVVRAKRTLAEAGVPFEVPRGAALAARLSSVLEVIYLVFNEGYSATAGSDWMRPTLCDEALRLGRILAELAPREAEVHGLVALMEIQASRSRARVGPSGEPVLLLDQNRALWDQLLIRRGLSALARAEALGGAPGPYVLQAAIAAGHARARSAADTDWAGIAALYQALAALAPSPVVELNRAVAVGMASGPAAGLALVDALRTEPALERYHLLPSVRADLLARLGRLDEACAELTRAASLTRNVRERALLLERAAACASGSVPPRGPGPERAGARGAAIEPARPTDGERADLAIARASILVVDDNPMNLKLVSSVLESEGFDVRTALDALQALQILDEYADESRPRLILVDVQMPGIDGLELTRRLKADPRTRTIRVVALTAAALPGDEARALEAGCEAYLTKPIDTRALPRLVAQWLRRPPP